MRYAFVRRMTVHCDHLICDYLRMPGRALEEWLRGRGVRLAPVSFAGQLLRIGEETSRLDISFLVVEDEALAVLARLTFPDVPVFSEPDAIQRLHTCFRPDELKVRVA